MTNGAYDTQWAQLLRKYGTQRREQQRFARRIILALLYAVLLCGVAVIALQAYGF